MKKSMQIFSLSLSLTITCVLGCNGCTEEKGWGWKRATKQDDVMNFLNTTEPYTQIIKRADITAIDKGSYVDFIVFYQKGDSSDPHGGWGWKKSTEPDDVKDFLSGDGAYNKPVVSAEIAAIKKQAFTEFYVFYTR